MTGEDPKVPAVKVGMAQFDAVGAPGVLGCYGIGSCVVIALYDPEEKIAGLAHAMLPTTAVKSDDEFGGKYADTAPFVLVEAMEAMGASREKMIARLVGGATMFSFSGAESGGSLGDRNAEVARNSLSMLGISLQSEDTGGNYGRSIELAAEDGSLQVRTAARGTRWL